MAFSAGQGGASGRGGRRRGRRRQTLSEINVTPLVDVMLVLLIIFMISAPLLTAGVKVDLPKTEAGAIQDQTEPLTITVKKDGTIFVQEAVVSYDQLGAKLDSISAAVREKPIFVRADGGAPYEAVAKVMAKLSISGFPKISLITDTSAPTPGPKAGPNASETPTPAAP